MKKLLAFLILLTAPLLASPITLVFTVTPIWTVVQGGRVMKTTPLSNHIACKQKMYYAVDNTFMYVRIDCSTNLSATITAQASSITNCATSDLTALVADIASGRVK